MLKTFTYTQLIVSHLLLGFLMYNFEPLRRVYFFILVGYWILRIVLALPSKKTYTVLLACSYMIGAEVLLRTTGATLFYEISKYTVILFILMGMFFNGVKGSAWPYFLYLILLVPSVLVASGKLGLDLNFRSSVAFVLSGPVCLGISALYFHDRTLKHQQLLDALASMSMPVVSLMVYLFLYNPNIKDVLTGTGSNRALSGGFGPNQTATILGLGIFCFTVRFFLKSPSLFLKLLNGGLLALIAFRGIVTFSRGGIFTAILMVGAFLVFLYGRSSYKVQQRLIGTSILFVMLGLATWFSSANQTDGLIERRYANEDAAGREKDDISTGRVDLFIGELDGFFSNPFFGVGANGMKQERLDEFGKIIASHNEISRLLSEHGIFGLIVLLILIFAPLSYRSHQKSSIYFYAFFFFWFATINHSAMRLAAPGFIYALALIRIKYEKPPLRRQLPQPPA
ncbi:O-antigen ligase family protein [Paucihalobacter sp.]|uniref:O-antigen ligase family protein n=1 Tax=Paucihalobacter sp. TaxID=2850405 RepID=UPI002FDFA8DC